MTKKNKVIYRLLGVFVVLLLVSLCLLGSTFARYTTKDTATSSVKVAEWNVVDSNSASTSFSTGTALSPNEAAYTAGQSSYNATYARSNSVSYGQILGLVNTGDVEADITLTLSAAITYNTSSSDYNSNSGEAYYCIGEITSFDSNYTYYTESAGTYTVASGSPTSSTTYYIGGDSIVNAHIKLSLYSDSSYSSALTLSNNTYTKTLTYTQTTDTTDQGKTYYTQATDGTWKTTSFSTSAYEAGALDVYAKVVWTSDISSNIWGETADSIDTWIAQNITNITYTFDWSAVQGSTVPSSGTVTPSSP